MFPTIGAWPSPAVRHAHDDPRPTARGSSAAATLAAVSAERSVDGQLQLTTKEGDTVTISAHAEASVTYAALRARGGEGLRYASLEASREVTLEVQGDLSEQELAEIEKVVKAFFHELRDAFRGRPADVGDVAEAGDGASTLAGFSVHLDASASVTAVAVVAKPLPGAQPLPVAPAPPDEAAAGVEAGVEPAPAAPANAPGVLGRLLSVARGSGLAPQRMEHVLERVFDRFARALRSADERAVLEALRQGVRDGLSAPAPEETRPVDGPAAEAPVA